jgi:glutamyl-tRNA synthetase
MRIEGIKLSKSKAQKEVRAGIYSGWDDPRTWSMQSLRKRGITPQAVRNFVLSVGLSQSDITVPIDALYKENRRIIDPIALRYFFVPGPVLLEIKDARERTVQVPLHPDFPERGTREIRLKGRVYIWNEDAKNLREGVVVRLKDLINIRIIKSGETLVAEEVDIADIKRIQKIQWVPYEDNIRTKVVMPDGEIVEGFAESSCIDLKPQIVIQFERFGFCCVDKVDKVNKELIAYYTHR